MAAISTPSSLAPLQRPRRGEEFFSRFREGEAFAHAVAVLDPATRQELVETLDADFGPPGFFGTLVGSDPKLFDTLLARVDLKQVHMEPLAGRPAPKWNQLAKQALAAGYASEDLVAAVHGLGWSWTGNESSMWEGWAESFRSLEQEEDERLREIGRIGRERAESRATTARDRERQEEVYGFG